ncbi:hypothetical protein SOVF_201890, partial [Spinacia oleracea]
IQITSSLNLGLYGNLNIFSGSSSMSSPTEGHVLRISNFKDDSSRLAWGCSDWVRKYALFLKECSVVNKILSGCK